VYRGIDNIWLGTFGNDREDSLEVTTEDQSETTKRHIRVTNLSASMIKCLLTVRGHPSIFLPPLSSTILPLVICTPSPYLCTISRDYTYSRRLPY
jgi:hypothetical protein